jgi:hypothetical protein
MNDQKPQPAGAVGEGNAKLSTSEVRAAIAALDPDEKRKLKRTAKMWSNRFGITDDEKILQTALARALDGTRKCPRELAILPFLFGAIRSISSSEAKSIARSPIDQYASPLEELETEQHLDDGAEGPTSPSPERILVARAELVEVQSWFQDDEEVQLLMLAIGEGLEGEELEQELGWTKIQHGTIRRRMRREIEKRLNKGREAL